MAKHYLTAIQKQDGFIFDTPLVHVLSNIQDNYNHNIEEMFNSILRVFNILIILGLSFYLIIKANNLN